MPRHSSSNLKFKPQENRPFICKQINIVPFECIWNDSGSWFFFHIYNCQSSSQNLKGYTLPRDFTYLYFFFTKEFYLTFCYPFLISSLKNYRKWSPKKSYEYFSLKYIIVILFLDQFEEILYLALRREKIICSSIQPSPVILFDA